MVQQFFIYRDGQREGPFSLEDLKEKSIQSDTWLWHEGLTDWVKASDVPEVRTILTRQVPPQPVVPPPVVHPTQEKQKGVVPLPRKSYATTAWILGIALFLSLAFSGFLVFINQGQNNHVENLEKALAVQDTIIGNQRDSLANLKEEAHQQMMAAQAAQRQANLVTIGNEYSKAVDNLNQAKDNLKSAQSFHLLRSSSDRDAQIEAAQNEVNHWAQVVDSLAQIRGQLGD